MRPNIQGFQSKADLLWVSRGLRRGRDAYPMDSRFKIPAPLVIRTAGTREGKQSREWKAARKRRRGPVGKTAGQPGDVTRTEI